MSTAITPARPPTAAAKTTATATPTARISPGRIVERTTTITREIFLDDPTPPQTKSKTEPASETQWDSETRAESEIADGSIHGIDRALVRLGVWLIGLGRRHALHPSARTATSPAARPAARADEIARRVDAAKAHDMRHFIGLPY